MSGSFAAGEAVAEHICLSGHVQGSGIRPAIARLATRHQLGGSVRNSQQGVDIEIVGRLQSIEDFKRSLRQTVPEAEQSSDRGQAIALTEGPAEFEIIDSDTEGAARFTIPLDRVICPDCLRECLTPGNRRFGYALNGCAHCGPRYSILRAMPYDRKRTGMSEFRMCAECQAEYEDLADRRFHAQTNCCPQCGPHLWFDAHTLREPTADVSPIDAAAAAILDGRILAMKGVGGYQLVCDATNRATVDDLRRRKGRRARPLAVMVPSVAAARDLAQLDLCEEQALRSPAGPIVLARAARDLPLAPNVHCGLADVGLMLPTSAMHALLLARVRRPLIVTSGNREGEPLEYQEDQATTRLGELACCFLHHNRPIIRPIDDSVVRCMSGQQVHLRAARGLAPMPLASETERQISALSAQQKTAVAICNGHTTVLGPHVGDLNNLSTRDRFVEQHNALANLLGSAPTTIAHDLHPDYFTSKLSQELAASGVETVQHHHAHIVAGMVEQQWLDREVLGFAFDGTGAGEDGTVWGGEVLLSTVSDYQRVASVRPFRLAGGEAAVRQPWRVAVALLADTVGDDVERIASVARLDVEQVRSVKKVLRAKSLSPTTTSMGRLFDGVAALVCGIRQSGFEGEAAMRLEAVCSRESDGAYPLTILEAEPLEMDWRPMMRELAVDLLGGVSPGVLSMRFHRAIANWIAQLAARLPHVPVVLAGGVFQNRVLVELVKGSLAGHPSPVAFPARIPPNDGGLAAGQLAVAANRIKRGKPCV